MNEFVTYVKRYHTSHRKPYRYFGAMRENFKGIGVELEFDSTRPGLDIVRFRDNCAKLLAEHRLAEHYFIERDSSLKCGFEIVTQPHTIPAMKEFFTEFSEVFPQLIEFGAEDGIANAALHIHVGKKNFGLTSEEQIDRIAKIIAFVANHPNDWVKQGRRKETKKCAPLTDLTTKELAVSYVRDTYNVKEIDRRKIERYVAVNLRNKTTVEFRTMQTTFDLDIIFAEIDFVNYLVERSAEIDWEDVADARKWLEKLPENVKEYMIKMKAYLPYL